MSSNPKTKELNASGSLFLPEHSPVLRVTTSNEAVVISAKRLTPLPALNNNDGSEMKRQNTFRQSDMSKPSKVSASKGGNADVENNKRETSETNELSPFSQSHQTNPNERQTPGRPPKRIKLLNGGPIIIKASIASTTTASKRREENHSEVVQKIKAGFKQLESIHETKIMMLEEQLQEAKAAKAAEMARSDERVREVMARSEAHSAELAKKVGEARAEKEAEVGELETRIQQTEHEALQARKLAVDANKAAEQAREELKVVKEAG